MNIVVLIPAYNAADTIGALVKKVKELGFFCVVVDDGSTDDTYKNASSAGVIVLKHEKNMGKGAALRTGFDYILKGGYDYIVTLDADGQNDPLSIKDFIGKAEKSGASIIVGNRLLDTAGMPWIRVQTNRFMSWLLSKKIGQRVPDTQCGYKLIRKDLLAKLKLCANHYEIESEMLIKAGKAGAKIDSVVVSSIYSGQKSHINPIVDTLRFIKLIMTLK